MISLYFRYIMLPMIIGFVWDLCMGDPHNMWHPICFIGSMISKFENIIRNALPKTEKGELAGGVVLVISVLACATAIPLAIILICNRINGTLCLLVECYMCWTILATKSLKDESMKVHAALKNDGLEAGRKAVSMIVGRDTAELSEEGVIKAAVETIAENTSDGIIAPMIFMFIGGPVIGYFYKAANTMDSMVGYKNDKYLYFGRAAARFDDFMNYLPSRIAARLMIFACPFVRLNSREAKRIWKRDRRNHASPNSAQTESVMAGALGVRLAGDASYFGVIHHKPFIGDDTRPIELDDIKKANKLLYATAITTLILMMLILFLYVAVLVIILVNVFMIG